MAYATLNDVKARCARPIKDSESTLIEALLEDAAAIIDAYRASAKTEAKKVVSCNMVLRKIGGADGWQMPQGATQGSIAALGYSQSFTMGTGSVGELYLNKTDKCLLGNGQRIGFTCGLGEEISCVE